MKQLNILGLLTLTIVWSETTFAYLIYQLTTPSHVAFVIHHCESGVLDCRDVEYLGVERTTGKSLHMKGSSILSGRARNWMGYKFTDGDTEYRIHVTVQKADLRIYRDGRKLKNEIGTLIDL